MPGATNVKATFPSHVVGYPRMGPKRELKFALETLWDGKSTPADLLKTASELRAAVWTQMSQAGVSFIPSNVFSFYDLMLDTTAMVGAVPARYNWTVGTPVDLNTYFAMGRGNAVVPAMEMTKWFDTNYHYIVPELAPATNFQLSTHKALEEYKEAKALGIETVPVLIGPYSYLKLGKPGKGVDPSFDTLSLLPALLPIYKSVLEELKNAGAEYIQIDEPALILDPSQADLSTFTDLYRTLLTTGSAKIILQTYFAELPPATLDTLFSLPGVHAVGVDLVRGRDTASSLKSVPDGKFLLAGVVDGRNVWANDLEDSLKLLQGLEKTLGKGKVVPSTSCSLQHTAVDLDTEKEMKTSLDDELLTWMAFAKQKVHEVVALGKALAGQKDETVFAANKACMDTRRASTRVNNQKVRQAVAAENALPHERKTPVTQRLAAQQKHLKLPPLPTTTIGSFPQTAELRKVRRGHKNGSVSEAEYTKAIEDEIKSVVKLQVELDLDVLVHGEPERNDMVEYFGEQLAGFAFTSNGWVQSYGSRCVKPPVIYGDVERPKAMTVLWTTYAAKQAEGSGKAMKGMLTGPVTILNWSFVRNDQPRSETCLQIALAIQAEVLDLEAAGIKVIQIDEAALREGLPLLKKEQAHYLDWAVKAFRITSSKVQDTTQIHTHMCYSHFNDIMTSIVDMDTDVITIENSRSDEKLLRAFQDGGVKYPAGIGPGVYDIHSPRIPDSEEMVARLRQILAVLDRDVVWVNPDCGLKTRKYEQVRPALENMVAAAKKLRKEVAV